jgi:uncharacterized protein (DUF427 family)
MTDRGRIRVEQGYKRVRAYLGSEAIVDSTRPMLVWEIPYFPTYYFSRQDVRTDLLVDTGESKRSPSRGEATIYTVKAGGKEAVGACYAYLDSPINELADLIAFKWKALDRWFEEDEEVFAHARDPYTRIDILNSSRHVEVMIDGVKVADSPNPALLFETGLPVRYYLPKTDVRMDLLSPSATRTECPYKGIAEYWSVKVGDKIYDDYVWGYQFPTAESAKIAGLVSFYNEKVDIRVDGETVERPRSPFE